MARILAVAIAVFLLIVVFQDNLVSGQCCTSSRGWGRGGGSCRDGTRSTPCCGYGRCNFFCCACRGGCRRPQGRALFEIQPETQRTDSFNQFDLDQDGFQGMEEAYNMSTSCGKNLTAGEFQRVFTEFDVDGDGRLSWTELNEE